MQTARIIEIFSSIQGEGIYVGRKHLFVRFWDCNLACHYCDTDYRGPYREMTLEDLQSKVQDHIEREGPHQAVSLTGGEPLLWWRFLEEWLPQLKGLDQKIYLETNGSLPDSLQKVLPWIDTIAMDVKPPTATQDRPLWKMHEIFLQLAHAAKNHTKTFVKIVVTRETTDEELQRAFHLVSAVDARIPVILQPVTPWGSVQERPFPEQITRWHSQALQRLCDVRVLPQVHRMLSVP